MGFMATLYKPVQNVHLDCFYFVFTQLFKNCKVINMCVQIYLQNVVTCVIVGHVSYIYVYISLPRCI